MTSVENNKKVSLINPGKKRAGHSTIIKTPVHFLLGRNDIDFGETKLCHCSRSSDVAIVLVDNADMQNTTELEITVTTNRRGAVISTTAVVPDDRSRENYDSRHIEDVKKIQPLSSSITPSNSSLELGRRYNLTALIESTTFQNKKSAEISEDKRKDPLTAFLDQAISHGMIGCDSSYVYGTDITANNENKKTTDAGNMTSDTFILVTPLYSTSDNAVSTTDTHSLIGVPVDRGLWRMRKELPDINTLYRQSKSLSSDGSISKAWSLLVTPIDILKKKANVTVLTAEEEAGGDGIGGDASSGRVQPLLSQGTVKGNSGLSVFASIADRIQKDESDTKLLEGIMNEVHKTVSTHNDRLEDASIEGHDSAANAGAKRVSAAVKAEDRRKKRRTEIIAVSTSTSASVLKQETSEDLVGVCGAHKTAVSIPNDNNNNSNNDILNRLSPMKYFLPHLDDIISSYVSDHPELSTVNKEAVGVITKAVVAEVKKVPSNLKGYSRDEMRDILIELKKCVEEALAKRFR